ncbi:secretion protein HlyD [Intrasporangium oryzae NRRL B-24470]|uniref:Secretion protein HlyD n=1 Tax=Intrasporangium oryzae NRRL B-24470 TaxID=1386089 RepID=W9G7S4_9MICO|nr:DUF4307 domain-containing protein [Intrasporangium oryzae]EWS99918.1 secretion protein HlyD [Intrasporangium oryzae NRRL B-24470]
MPLPRPAPGTLRWWVIGTIGVAAGVALATWFGLAATVGRPSWQTTSYKVVDDRTVNVTFEVHSPDGKALTCIVQALARDFSTVGSLAVEIPASDSADSRHTVSVRTTSRAVTGEVRTCD